MAIVVRLYNINSPNNFTVSIKEGNSAYPLLSTIDYTEYGTYSGGTTEIDITDYILLKIYILILYQLII